MLTNNDLQAIRGIVKEEVQILDKKLDKVQDDISEILTGIISSHDSLKKRVDHIEEHLEISSSQ